MLFCWFIGATMLPPWILRAMNVPVDWLEGIITVDEFFLQKLAAF